MEGVVPAIDSIISKDEIKHFSRKGGNALSMSEGGPHLGKWPYVDQSPLIIRSMFFRVSVCSRGLSTVFIVP